MSDSKTDARRLSGESRRSARGRRGTASPRESGVPDSKTDASPPLRRAAGLGTRPVGNGLAPGSANPGSANPGSAYPGPADPGSAYPGPADPGSADPGPAAIDAGGVPIAGIGLCRPAAAGAGSERGPGHSPATTASLSEWSVAERRTEAPPAPAAGREARCRVRAKGSRPRFHRCRALRARGRRRAGPGDPEIPARRRGGGERRGCARRGGGDGSAPGGEHV